jgi:hypothetical protein
MASKSQNDFGAFSFLIRGWEVRFYWGFCDFHRVKLWFLDGDLWCFCGGNVVVEGTFFGR